MSASSFGAGAARLAGVAARLLGWRPGEFWAATPAELATAMLPEPETADAPLTRGELDALIARETGV